jgi:hypothetical protein
MEDLEIVDYAPASSEYLRRAREQLELFDKGNWPSLFYAALELKVGIEMRSEEYWTLANKEKSPAKKYRPQEFRGELLKANPEAGREHRNVLVLNARIPFGMRYTPVSEKLAKEYYGRVCGLLHRTFCDHEEWFFYKWWKEQRDLLQIVCNELEYACSGNLLNAPNYERKLK